MVFERIALYDPRFVRIQATYRGRVRAIEYQRGGVGMTDEQREELVIQRLKETW